MTDRELIQQALDALVSSRVFVTSRDKIKHPEGTDWYDKRITALREALAQPEQEPVAWVSNRNTCMIWWNDKFTDISQAPPRNTPLYTAPPKREWVGLTEEERLEILAVGGEAAVLYVTEAKLKEKNT